MASGSSESASSSALEVLMVPRHAREELRPFAGDRGYEEMEAALAEARPLLEGRTLWHVTSDATGGVAEVLHSLLGYVRDGGIDVKWGVVHGGRDFLSITRRLYEGLYGAPSSGFELGADEHSLYARVLTSAAAELSELIVEGDIVLLYDPPTAGMIQPLQEAGARVVWRCHLGMDEANSTSLAAQRFLLPYVQRADATVFSRKQFVWPDLREGDAWVIPPSINPLSPKNQPLDPEVAGSILDHIGLTEGGSRAAPVFTRLDGSPFRVGSEARVEQERPIPASSHVVTHISSWDRLKDPGGLLECFAEHCPDEMVDLVVAGPGTDNEPNAEALWTELVEQARGLPPGPRSRVHLVALPMGDAEENAAMVNAIQRRAAVVVRKSFAEGFGLTLAESMWKEKPVVATRVGGIQDLVVHGETGLLVDDPRDYAGFAEAIESLISQPSLAMRLAASGRQRVRERYLISRHLKQYLELAIWLVGSR